MKDIATTSMSVFQNLDCLSLVVCSDTILLKFKIVLFFLIPDSALRNRGCGLSIDAAYIRTFTVLCAHKNKLLFGLIVQVKQRRI